MSNFPKKIRMRRDFGKTPRSGKSLSKRLLTLLVVSFLVVMCWHNLLLTPTSTCRPTGYNYPDIFQFKTEYLHQYDVLSHVVNPGDSLYSILSSFKLSPAEILKHKNKHLNLLNRLRPGDQLTLYIRRSDRKLAKILYTRNRDLFIFRNREGRWLYEERKLVTTKIRELAKGRITDNLYDSCLRAGLPEQLIMELADLFSFDIDFNTDLRPGDTFSIYYEQQVADGKLVHAGPILAAKMTVGGNDYEAFYYTLPDGYSDYFDAEGRSLRKLFLKAPLRYRRISSRFSYRRFHPILRIYRPHLGIDYAAPTGTPVWALGDGKIIFKGRKGGFGNFIAIAHGRHYKTTYGHLSRFASGLKVGDRVKQGEIIGYVGATGLATGPHLDFRFYKDGRPVNFLKIKFPYARSIPRELMADFQLKRRRLLAALEGNTGLALK